MVGVDGSLESAAALAYAFDDAVRRRARLRVVTAVRIPEYWNTAYRQGAPPPPPELVEGARKAARETAESMLHEVIGTGGERTADVPVKVDVVTGVPAAVLLEAAQDADHVVLGHRGRGWIASAVLGSVGLQCVLHATCPVTVVPRETPGSGARHAPG